MLAAQAKPLPVDVVERVAAQIDQALTADLQKSRLMPEPIVNDAIFVRRAYLGIIGRIPSAKEAGEFLDDKSVSRRDALIDRLVASPGFDSHLFNWTADLLRVQTRQDQYGLGWHVWLRESLAKDKPWDELVAEMLQSTGHSTDNPAVGYYLRDRNMQLDNFSNTMQVFLGQQIGCAQCHDHPFDDWTQYEYYQMASFGGGMQYRSEDVQQVMKKAAKELYLEQHGEVLEEDAPKGGPGCQKKDRRQQQEFFRKISRELQPIFNQIAKNGITEQSDSQLKLPQNYKYKDAKPGDVVPPETLFGPKLKDVAAEDRKQAFAKWVTSPENPYFTKTIANRMWHRIFGHPLLDSLDNLSKSSKTAHPKALSLLENAMQQCDYDLRQFSRILYHTQLFQRACMKEEPAPGEPILFQGMVLRRMSAEQLFDSFVMLRAGEIDDSPSPTLKASWGSYVQMVDEVFKSEAHELLQMAETAKQGEERMVKARGAFQLAREALSAATSPKDRAGAQVVFNEARKELEEARHQANPLRSMMEMNPRGKGQSEDWVRSSELPAPFNPGTLMRDFGGSDRATPSSSHAEATVPQALVLMNNWKTDLIAGPKSHLADELRKQDSPEGRLDVLFLTLFSERPEATEKQKYLPMAKDVISLRDLATAMVNSKRFLYIQ